MVDSQGALPGGSPRCHACGADLSFKPGTNVGRSETCSKCGNDVRVCYNCMHYDARSYNECHESQAERVVDKAKRNFCDFFSLGRDIQVRAGEAKSDVLKKLDDLFKK